MGVRPGWFTVVASLADSATATSGIGLVVWWVTLAIDRCSPWLPSLTTAGATG